MFDYVAYADDDTIPAPNWLSALSATIEEHGALVVGGRIEDVYEGGLELPNWARCKYLKGFFRLDYRDKMPDVFRIRYPFYIGAANSVYARHLFEQIQFPTNFGPAGKRRLRGSESFLNLALEMRGVPIYYTDHAVVRHRVSAGQVTHRALIKASYLSGIEDARRESVLLGFNQALGTMKNEVRQLRALLRADLRSPREARPFCTFCRSTRTLALVVETMRLLGARIVGIRGSTTTADAFPLATGLERRARDQ